MIRRRTTCMSAITLVVVLLLPGITFGQQTLVKEQLVGTWTLVSHESVRADGSRFAAYGTNPKGIAFFDAGGDFVITVMRADRAKYAVDFPAEGTAEENRATAQGTMTYFGRYTVNEADRTIAIHIEASSFPNWNGTDQKRVFTITGDQLTLTARALQTGGHADVVWNRAK